MNDLVERLDGTKMRHRFHVLGIPHTISVPEYSACAFTQKVVKLCKLLKSRGHTVINYGHEDSRVECDEHVTVTKRYDLHKAYGDHDWRKKGFPNFDLNDHAYRAFNRRAINEIHERKQPNDFLLCTYGHGHRVVADAHSDLIVCEPGIGYPGGHFAPYKVFESYAILHAYLGLPAVGTAGNEWWYDAVIPNYYDLDDFEFADKKDDYFLFLGRVNAGKGIHIAVQIAEALNVRLVIAGAGNVDGLKGRTNRPISEYVEFLGVVGPEQRRRLLAKARATICASTFVEPFCGVHVESMLSGTPVISTDWGAFAEYNIHGVTGYRCRTFEQFVWAARNIDRIDPHVCRQWAATNFSLDRVADMYDEYFDGVRNIFGKQGWYEANPTRVDLNWLYKQYPRSEVGTRPEPMLVTD